MTTDPIQRAFDGCAHEATTTQVRHTGTLQACDDCGQTWSFPATSATESDETSSSGSGHRSSGDRPADGRTADDYRRAWMAAERNFAREWRRAERHERTLARVRALAEDGIRDGRGQAPQLGRALLTALDGGGQS